MHRWELVANKSYTTKWKLGKFLAQTLKTNFENFGSRTRTTSWSFGSNASINGKGLYKAKSDRAFLVAMKRNGAQK